MNDTDRPPHWTSHNAAAFALASVVDAYHLRTPYPFGLAVHLSGLMTPKHGAVVELGCGTGEISRMLAPHAERIDAIDISEPMLAKARSMAGGDHPAIRWIQGAAEDVVLTPPYALAVAGDALHWMDWDVVLPRVRDALSPGAVLAIVSAVAPEPPWWAGLQEVIRRHSVMQDFVRFDLIGGLAARGLFQTLGEATVAPEPFDRSVDEYVESLHATAGMPRERMGDVSARAFDEAVRRLVEPFADAGVLHLSGSARVVSGNPAP